MRINLQFTVISISAFVVVVYIRLMYRFNYNVVAALTISFAESHGATMSSAVGCNDSSSSECPTVLIGIGAMKSGSTYLLDALCLSNRGVNLSSVRQRDDQSVFSSLRERSGKELAFLQPLSSVNDGSIRNVGELKYWTWCWSSKWPRTFSLFQSVSGKKLRFGAECSFRDYVQKWNRSSSEAVLVEKSANYIREPHTAKLLGDLSHSAPIKVYVSLREPVERSWSHYFYCCFNRERFLNFQCDRDRIVERINGDLDGMKRRYPDWHKMMELMDGENAEDLILYFYQKGFYSMNNLIANDDALISSCYYPQIKMWAQSVAAGSLKVFEYEAMVRNISNVIFQLRNWLDADNRYYAQIPIDRQQLLRRHRTLKYNDKSKNTAEIPPELRARMTAFFRPCTERLDAFFRDNPSLLLLPSK